MESEKWNEFLYSIKTSGVIEPIVCTQNKVIVSGHQRIWTCKALGIKEVICEVRHYENADKIIKDLLETNIRQRGEIGGSSIKTSRRINELDRLYGVQHGGNRSSKSANGTLKKTQEQLANELGIELTAYKRYKRLTTLIPELQELVDSKISPSVASRILSKLTSEEQQDLNKNFMIE